MILWILIDRRFSISDLEDDPFLSQIKELAHSDHYQITFILDGSFSKSDLVDLINRWAAGALRVIELHPAKRASIRQRLKVESPDLLHIHNPRNGSLALWFYRTFKIPVITSESPQNQKKPLRFRHTLKKLYRISSANMVGSNETQGSLQDLFGTSFQVYQDDNSKNELSSFYPSITDKVLIYQASRELSSSGGISNVALQLATEFEKQKRRCISLTAGFSDEPAPRIPGYGIRFTYPLWYKKVPYYLQKYLKTLFFTKKVNQFYRMKNKDPHCVTISHRDSYGADIAIGHSCHKEALRIKKQTRRSLWWLNPVHHLYLKQERRICRKPGSTIAAISQSIAREYMKHYAIPSESIEIIPNGVDLQRFSHDKKEEYKSWMIQQWKLPENAFILLFVGNEFKRKGLEHVLKALKALDKEKAVLFVLGEAHGAPYIKMAEEMGLGRSVFFLGRREDAPPFFAGADLFILPADYEPFGLVGMEALSSGTPILVTETGGFLDYLNPGVNGFFIRPDKEDICDKILCLYNDHTLWHLMSSQARKSALKYDWAAIAEDYLQLIDRIGARKAGNISK